MTVIKIDLQNPIECKSTKNKAQKINKVRAILNKCHASVVKTNNVEERKNFSP